MAKKSGRKTAKSKRVVTKPVAKQPSVDKKAVKVPRTIKQKPVKGLRRLKPVKHPGKLPSVFKITKMAVRVVSQHRKLLLGISLVYGILDFILVRSQSVIASASDIRTSFDQTLGGHPGSVVSGIGTFFGLLGSSNSTSGGSTSTYQLLLLLIVSLAVIWALRQVMAGNKVRIRDSYYKGMYPFIPVILIFLVIGLQLLPLVIGSSLYSLVITTGIASTGGQQLFWLAIFVVLGLLTMYLLASSLFAVYLVTLPDMTPIKALRSARQIVRHRRWTVLRKILFLPILLLLTAGVIVVPVIIWLPAAADWLYFLLLILAPLAVNAYMYTLYRELLNE